MAAFALESQFMLVSPVWSITASILTIFYQTGEGGTSAIAQKCYINFVSNFCGKCLKLALSLQRAYP